MAHSGEVGDCRRVYNEYNGFTPSVILDSKPKFYVGDFARTEAQVVKILLESPSHIRGFHYNYRVSRAGHL